MLSINIKLKQYEQQAVISGLEFDINKGEFLAIVGPSGCGKTTLLNMLGALDQQFEGSVSPSPDTLNIGYLFQSPRLMPWLTSLQNIQLVMQEDSEHLAQEWLERVGVAERQNAYPAHMSGGQQRRVALARALIRQPDLLLLDEPFISLDQPTADRLRQLTLELSSVTTVLVTHDLREALQLADRILFLSPAPGKLIYEYVCEDIKPRNSELVRDREAELMASHPELLSGITRSDGD